MATTDTASYGSNGVPNFQVGGYTSDGGLCLVTLGFKPAYVKVINETDVIVWEWIKGMGSTKTVKTVTAGTTTIDTGSAIVDNDNGTFTISATASGTSKVLTWVAHG